MNDLVYSKINEKISLGPYPYFDEIKTLGDKGFKALLNLQTHEDMERLGYSSSEYEEVSDATGVHYLNCQIENFSKSEISAEECLEAVKYLSSMVEKFK